MYIESVEMGRRNGANRRRIKRNVEGGELQHQDRGCRFKPDGAGRGGAVALDPERVKRRPCARKEHARGWGSGEFVLGRL